MPRSFCFVLTSLLLLAPAKCFAQLISDHNGDGFVTHADYSLIAHYYGVDPGNMPGRGFPGIVGIADFVNYRESYGNSIDDSTNPATPFSMPFAVSRFATTDGNSQWILTSKTSREFATHLNIQAEMPITSIGYGTRFMPVPGRLPNGQIVQGTSFAGTQAFAALGTKLGEPTSINSNFLTLFTTGTGPATLNLSGEYGIEETLSILCPYCASDYSFTELVVFNSPAPGNSPSNPVLPNESGSGEFIFTNVPSGLWFDPPLVERFEYVMDSGSLFTSILDFPPGFDEPFEVIAEDTSLGFFDPGQSLDFVSLIGHGVDRFTVANITPLVDAEDPNGFPLKLAFDTPIASFRMIAIPVVIPEPATLWLASIVGIALASRWRSPAPWRS